MGNMSNKQQFIEQFILFRANRILIWYFYKQYLILLLFFSSIRQFYCAVVKKMVAKFPFKDPVVNSLSFLNPEERGDVTFGNVMNIVKRFPVLVTETQLSQLEEEFNDYQVTPSSEMPVYTNETNVDTYWSAISEMKNKVTKTARFPLLSRVCKAMCSIPNSNADCERVFSIVKHIQTEQRSCLDNTTLCALLTTKINTDCLCFQLKPEKDQLLTAKKACVTYNSLLRL